MKENNTSEEDVVFNGWMKAYDGIRVVQKNTNSEIIKALSKMALNTWMYTRDYMEEYYPERDDEEEIDYDWV